MDLIKYVIFCMIWGTDPDLSRGAATDTIVGIAAEVVAIALFIGVFIIVDNKTNWKIPVKIIFTLTIMVLFIILSFVVSFLFSANH